jgi:nucleolar protein TMA23
MQGATLKPGPAKISRIPSGAPLVFHLSLHPLHPPDERRIVLAQARLEGLWSLTRLDWPWNQEAAAHRAQAGPAGPREEEGGMDDGRPVVDARIRPESAEHWNRRRSMWNNVTRKKRSPELTPRQSTLNQIRTKGINRGGLYGFFVKGEAIAGTIEDSSATDASIPPSGASTPPTSASESEAPTKTAKMSDKKNKRKREAEDAPEEAKEAKKTKTKQAKSGKKGKKIEEGDPVARKIAKLSPRKKARYEDRAAAKGQTIEQYISRRIYKKSAYRASTKLNKPASASSESAPTPFFTDLSGDATLISTIPALPAPPLPLPIDSVSGSESDGPPEPPPSSTPKKIKKVRKADLPSDVPSGKKACKDMIREKRQEKKERKKEHGRRS